MNQLPGATLSEFIFVVDDFDNRLKEIIAKIAESPKVRHRRRGQLSDCGLDIVNCALSFYKVHADAAFWQQDDTAMVTKTFTGGPSWLPTRVRSERIKNHLDDSARSLVVGYKSLLFFFRTFQDAAHAVMLELTGHKSGMNSTMSACVKNPKAPVYKIITEIPEYVDWFSKMRAQRNEIKGGIGFAIVGPQWDVGVGFVEITDDNAMILRQDQLHIKDLVQSVEYSHKLLDAMAALLAVSTEPAAATSTSPTDVPRLDQVP